MTPPWHQDHHTYFLMLLQIRAKLMKIGVLMTVQKYVTKLRGMESHHQATQAWNVGKKTWKEKKQYSLF